MKDVIIKIIDRHIQDGDEYTSELTTEGKFEYTDNICKIVYRETVEELMDCETTLLIEGTGKIILIRSGRYTAEITIERDRRHNCFYSTPYGELLMGVYCKKIECELSEKGGMLDFAYLIDFNNVPTSENELNITVVEK